MQSLFQYQELLDVVRRKRPIVAAQIDNKSYKALTELAARTEHSVSFHVRKAIEVYLEVE